MKHTRTFYAIISMVAGACLWALPPVHGEEAGLTVWPVDPLVKVFRDATDTMAAWNVSVRPAANCSHC